MPMKKGKSFEDVNKGLDRFQSKVSKQIGRALYASATTGAGISKTMTPVDTSNLINSQFINVEPTATGWKATIGFTANYAAAVHSKPGTLLSDPRYWRPDAEPQFLRKGFEGENYKIVTDVFYKALKL